MGTEEGESPRPGVVRRLLVVAVRAVAHEAVSGLGVDDACRGDALRHARSRPAVCRGPVHRRRGGWAERLTQLVGDAAPVEGDRSGEALGVQGAGPCETPAHAEAGDPDPLGTQAPERVGRRLYVPEHLLGSEGPHQRRIAGGLGATGAEEQVGRW